MTRRFVAAALLSAAAACQGPPAGLEPPPDADVDAWVPPGETVRLAAGAPATWPGGGTELAVRIETSDGMAVPGNQAPGLVVHLLAGGDADVAARPQALAAGYTSLLLVPGADADATAEVAAAAAALVDARPADERIGLFVWASPPVQLVNFTTDRALLDVSLGRFGAAASAADLGAAGAAGMALDELLRIGGPADRSLRALVVLGPVPVGAELPPTDLTPIVLWAVEGLSADAVAALGAGRALRWEDHGGAAGAALAASARLDEMGAGAYYRLGLCGPTGGGAAELGFRGEPGSVSVSLPPTLPEERALPCDPEAIAAGERAYPDRIELSFTAEQRATYDALLAAKSKDDFPLSVRIGDRDPVPATAHLRGKGALGCQRKSYAVDLDGPEPRFFAPGSATDEIYLSAMCEDDYYFHQQTSFRLLAGLGLFPLASRFVELRIDGETAGVYLLIEKMTPEMRTDNAGVRSVVRRGFTPPATPLEVHYARTTAADVKAAYQAFLDSLTGRTGDQLEAALRAHLDLDHYLRWLAFDSSMHNGDYVDEAWLLSTDHVGDDGTIGDYYTLSAWDLEDLFSNCHYNGGYAFVDPAGLTYCAEAQIDHLMLADQVVYGRYADELAALLAGPLTDAAIDDALAQTREELLPFFESGEICQAMVELLKKHADATNPAVAQRVIREEMDGFSADFHARRAELLQRLDDLRGP